MKPFSRAFSLFYAFFLILFSEAEAKKVLSLKEAVTIAIQRNPEISAALKEKESVIFKRNVVRSEFYPKLYLNYNYQRQDAGKHSPSIDSLQFGPTLSWNVFSGFSTWYAYKEIGNLIDASEALVKLKIQDIALRVALSYLNYLKDRSLWEASLNDIEDAKLTLHLTKKRYEVGLSPFADVLDAEARLKEAEANAINYKYSSEVEKAKLLSLLNISVLEIKDFEILDFTEEELKEPEFESLILTAKKKRPEILAKEMEIAAQQNRIKSVRGEYYPTVDLFSYYYLTGRSFFPDQDKQFVFGIRLSLPLFTGFLTSAKISAERATLEKKNYEKRSLELLVEQEVFSSYQTYLTKKEHYTASLAYLRKMEEDYRIVKKRYENGLASIVELTTVLARLSHARSQVARARYDWYLNFFQLRKSIGFVPGLE